MLFMVVERFKDADARSVGERFRCRGRMLPEGVKYLGSWFEVSALRCFQLMEARDQQMLVLWQRQWEDLVDFDVVPVVTAAEFWSHFGG